MARSIPVAGVLVVGLVALLACSDDQNGSGGSGGKAGSTGSAGSAGSPGSGCSIKLSGSVTLGSGLCFAVQAASAGDALQIHGDIKEDPAFAAAGIKAANSVWQVLNGKLTPGTYELSNVDVGSVNVMLADGTTYSAMRQEKVSLGSATLTLTQASNSAAQPPHGTVKAKLAAASGKEGSIDVEITFLSIVRR